MGRWVLKNRGMGNKAARLTEQNEKCNDAFVLFFLSNKRTVSIKANLSLCSPNQSAEIAPFPGYR